MKEIHGGDIYRNQVQMDFSVNVNPLGIPERVKKALNEAIGTCNTYPDMHCEKLKKKLANVLRVPEEHLVFGNGASELFMAIVHGLQPKKIVIPVPSFYGYEYVSRAVQAEVVFYEMKKEENFQADEEFLELLTEDVELVFLTNPNNPTGKLWERNRLSEVLKRCKEKQIPVVLDECFIEFADPDRSFIYEEEYEDAYENVMVVRAFTKIFSVPGVRLGYLYCRSEQLLKMIREQLPEWNISTFAQAAGCACCEESEFVEESLQFIKKERKFLEQGLDELGISYVKSDANFILLQSKQSLYEKLLEQGTMIRDCENFRGLKKGYYRVAVKGRVENERLLNQMKEIQIENVRPDEIENRSFEIISEELKQRGIVLPKEQELITKRVIHTSADFDYAKTMCYSDHAVEIAKELLANGADIVTDTNMAYSGINKRVLGLLGGEAHCFMADEDVAREAKERKVTRAVVSMEKASKIQKPVIFAVGNAPTALIQLHDMIQKGTFRPAFIIGVPVGFVNVEVAKELIMETDVPYIVNRGRKGGSNVAAAICNALLYQLKR